MEIIPMEKRKKRKLDMTPPQRRVLGESSAQRSQKLIAHTKAVIDDMVEKGIPLTVERVSLNAGCSKSFIYKNGEIRDYINNAKQKPTLGKRTYTDLEEAQKRIKELEIENMTLRMKNVGLFKIATNLYTRLANLTELNIRNMEQEMGEYDEEE